MFFAIADAVAFAMAIQGEDEALGRAESGFVGLDNQGATCYLNALLQVDAYPECLPARAHSTAVAPLPSPVVPSHATKKAAPHSFPACQRERNLGNTRGSTKLVGSAVYVSCLQMWGAYDGAKEASPGQDRKNI